MENERQKEKHKQMSAAFGILASMYVEGSEHL
jgi:hypothetical protein